MVATIEMQLVLAPALSLFLSLSHRDIHKHTLLGDDYLNTQRRASKSKVK